MKTTRITDENGCTHATNWMLDDIIDSFDKRELNDGSNDELITELAIQKIEYGRQCFAHFLTLILEDKEDKTKSFKTMKSYKTWAKFDDELKEKILELGGNPNEIKFYEKIE